MKVKRFLSSNRMTVIAWKVGAAFLTAGIWREEYTIVME